MKSLNLTKPHLIVVVGIPGAGKSFFGQQFSDTFNAPFLRVDDLRDMVADEKTVQKLWNYTLEKLLLSKQTMLLEGIGVTRAERRTISTYARSHGYQPLYVWVQTEPTTAQTRAAKSGMKAATFEEQTKKFEFLNGTEPYMVISGKHTYASQAKNVLKKLAEPRAEKTKLMPPEDRSSAENQSSPQRRGRITIN